MKFEPIELFMNAITRLTFPGPLGSAGNYAESPDGTRDYNTLFGYHDEPLFDDFYSAYRRSGIANVIVAKVAKACWRDLPALKLDEDEILHDEMAALKRKGLFRALERADILNRIGSFSVLLIGCPDGEELHKPLGTGKNMSQLYFNAYSEKGIEILTWDTDQDSVRYGLPLTYQLQPVKLDSNKKPTIRQAITVHWSRVVHLAENALDNEVEGLSSLEPVWNNLIDILKVRGSAAEAYYRNARQKYALEVDKDASVDNTPEGKAALKREVEAFTNNMQDFLRLKNMKVNQLQPSVVLHREMFECA